MHRTQKNQYHNSGTVNSFAEPAGVKGICVEKEQSHFVKPSFLDRHLLRIFKLASQFLSEFR